MSMSQCSVSDGLCHFFPRCEEGRCFQREALLEQHRQHTASTPSIRTKLEFIASAAVAEAERAASLWKPFNSAHEGFSVLKEEADELWAHVKTNQKKRDLNEMQKEAIQVAAMAIRFVVDICNEERGRR